MNLSKTVRMDELLEQMIKKTKTECEDILRLYIMNMHGAAAVQISMFQYAQAVSLYRMVLSKIKEFELLTVDDFQVNNYDYFHDGKKLPSMVSRQIRISYSYIFVDFAR